MSADVLVVGAGPTGLALALQAHDHGAAVRVVERREERAPSRALVVHPRTLEGLRPLGVVPELAARADRDPEVRLHLKTRELPLRVADLGIGDTPFHHPWLLRQRDAEEVLAGALAARGVRVETGTALVDLWIGHEEARVLLHGRGGSEQVTAHRVVGCDGAQGSVRARAGIAVRGARYRQEVVLADVELAGGPTPGVAHVTVGREGVVFVFALGEEASWRILVARGPGRAGDPGPAELQRVLDTAGLPGRVTDVAWSARLRLSHRVADTYRRGPVFLVGDAAHTHSPAAAQGMNLGLQDALNLGWKLGLAPTSTAPEWLLDSYGDERRPVARLSTTLTDLAFWAESAPDPLAQLLRGVLAPLAAPLLPVLLGQPVLTRPGMRLLSGLTVHHRRSPVSRDEGPRHGRLRAGDRLPDGTTTCDGRPVRLHDLVARPGVHVLLARDAPDLCPPPGARVEVHRLTDRPGSTVLAVRPDGYVGYRGPGLDPDHRGLRSWLGRVGAGRAGR